MREKISENKELIAIWDYEENNKLGYNPENLTCGSNKKVFWKCSKGHSYSMSVHKKLRNIGSCPVCSGHKTISGINDFATLHKDILCEWDYEKNVGINPYSLSEKNGKKVWWKCKYNHVWKATIHDRVGDHTGCPVCSSRRNTSFPEQAIYYYVHKLFPDARNRYKDIFDNQMELDIYIPSIMTAIEFDGAYFHNINGAHDREVLKYEICKKNGIRLIRVKQISKDAISYYDVSDVIYGVNKKTDLMQLSLVIQTILDDLDPISNLLTRKNPLQIHSKIQVNVEKDINEIREYLTEIPNNLAINRPDLIKEWHSIKNGKLVPEMFGINSNDRVWWKCSKCGHEWQTAIIHRAGKRNSGCPVCMNIEKGKTFTKRLVRERGSLAKNNPELAKEWHPTKNGELTPNDTTEKRFKKVWWKCSKCGHEWEQSPNSRSKGIGCPCCSGRVPKIGVNDLKTLNPSYLKEWDFVKNGNLKPENFLPNSGIKVWWKCIKCGYEWKTSIRTRNQGCGCPKCAIIKRKVTSKRGECNERNTSKRCKNKDNRHR